MSLSAFLFLSLSLPSSHVFWLSSAQLETCVGQAEKQPLADSRS